MQRDVTERKAIRKRRSFQGDRCFAAAWRGCDRSRKGARRDHLRQHHRRRFERLDLLLRVFPFDLVLNRENTDGAPFTDDRHAEEGVINLLPGLGLV